MSSINFRLYADQIYGLAISKLKDFITPEIPKDEFTSAFKEGQIKYSNIKNIKKLSPNPQISIDNLQIQNVVMNIPNETENFSMDLTGIKTEIELSDINDDEIENLLIKKRKDLINKFIEYAVKKAENKESSKSFIEGLLENLINRALNGLKINVSDFEIQIKYKNNIFTLVIEKIEYSEEKGMQINNISLSYNNIDNNKIDDYILKKFSVELNIENKKEENEENNNIINIKMSNFEYKLTKSIILAFNEVANLVRNTKYKYTYIRKKKLIQYYKPIKPKFDENTDISEKNKYYHSMWLYAIKTVIKLQKYVGFEKLYLLDLNQFIQSKISKIYIDNDNQQNNDKIILPTETNLLQNTKGKTEQKILDGKKGNVLANAFSFFFGGNKSEEKKELTEEEKSQLDNLYSDNEINKFIKGKIEDEKFKNNPIKEKIIKFMSNVKINLNFSKFELILANDDINICKLFIEGINLEITKKLEEINILINIKDIGSNLGDKLFSDRKKINENNDLISINIYEKKKIKINLGFNCIELNESMLNFFIIFFSSIKFKKQNNIFKEIKYDCKEIKEDNKEIKEDNKENKNDKENLEIMNNFCISNIPSLIVSNNENKIKFSVVQYSINKTKIEITYNISDSFGIILNNYKFVFNRDEMDNKYILHLDLPLRIKLSSETSKFIFISYLKLKERIKQIQKRNVYQLENNKMKEEEGLYNFNYIIHKKLDIKEFDITKLKIYLLFEKVVIEIYENNVKSKFSIHNFNLTYENRNLDLKVEKISIKTDLMSTMIIFLMDLESPNFYLFQHYIEEIQDEYKNKDKGNHLIEKKEEENNEIANIKYEYNIDYFLMSFSIYIKLLLIKFQSEDNIITYSIGNIKIKKEEAVIYANIGSVGFLYRKEKGKMFKIFNIDEETTMSIDPKENLVIMKITNPKANINLEALNNIRRSFQFLLEQVDWEIIICKVDLQIIDSNIKLNNDYNLSLSKISLKNFEGNKNDTIYFIINDLLIKNKKKEILLEQKNINIKMITESILKYQVFLTFSDLYINIVKDDIKYISSIVNQPEENQFQFKSKKTKHYIQRPENEKPSHEITFILGGKLNLFNFSLCDDNRKKKLEIIFTNFETDSKIFIPKEKEKQNEKNIKLNLRRINIIYNLDNGEEYNALEFKENINVNLEQKNLINFENKLSNKNQFELILSNENDKSKNDIIVNLNKFSFNLRLDILYYLYSYIKEYLPKKVQIEKEIPVDKQNNENESKLKINFNLFEINLHSINDENGIISIIINKLIINYLSSEYKEIKLDKYSISFWNNDEISYLLQTNKNTDFLNIKFENINEISTINSTMDEIIINVSFTDIYLLKEFINVNKKYYEKNKINLLKNEGDENKNLENKEKTLIIKSNLKKINFTLVDDYSNNYFPFLNFNLIDVNISSSDENGIKSSFYMVLSSYNYISSNWEPIIEKTYIKSSNIKQEENQSLNIISKIEIPNILVDISDMFISSILLSMKNLTKILDENEFNNMNKKVTDKETVSRISLSVNSAVSSSLNTENDFIYRKKPQTNNNIINYTGVPLKFKYGDIIYECDISSETNLINNNKVKNKKLIQIYYNDEKIINIPLKEIGYNYYKLNDKDYLVSENIISNNRQINILLYSPIIYKNKTNCSFQIKLVNPNLENLFILLRPNSISGIPLQYCNDETLFNIKIIKSENDNDNNESNLINLKDIIYQPNYCNKINMKNGSFILKLQHKIEKVKAILLTSEYKIINCLPCDIMIKTNDINRKIKKCSQFLIDFPDRNSLINLGIKVGLNDFFYCRIKLDLLFINNNNKNDGKKYLLFKNQRGQSFYLAYILKDKESYKGLEIYSDYILFNDSGIDFQFEENFIFNIATNIYIISNNINLKEESITLLSNKFSYSETIDLQNIVAASPFYKIYLNSDNNTLILPLAKKISSISLKNNPKFKTDIFSMIFYILPSCKITNLISNKKLIIKNFEKQNDSLIIPPLKQVSFNFFNKSRNNLFLELSFLGVNETKTEKINILNTLKSGIYTFNSMNEFYNLEIKDSVSEGNISIFVTEANLTTAKIVVINKTDIQIEIFQNKFEKFKQKIKENDSQILIIHDQIFTDFNAVINGKNYEIKFIPFKEEFDINDLEDDYVLIKESNGVKMKITILNKAELEKMKDYEKYLCLNFMINNCFISIIGDNFNKNKKLRNYSRNEILLFYMNNINTKINIKQNNSFIHKNNINFDISLQKCEVYNQISKKGKFACIFKNLNEPFLNANQEIDYYNNDKVLKINYFNITLSKLRLSLEPDFILKLIDFIDNIAYRIGKINYNVDKIFMRTDKNIKDITLKNNFRKYEFSQKLICFGSKFNFPEINIDFELDEQNLEKILTQKFGIPYLIIWILLGISKQSQNIHFEKAIIDNYFGDFSRLFQKARQNYETNALNVVLGLGLNGIWGQIKNFFIGIKNDLNSVDVVKYRIRYPRAFYGKYQSIRNYSEDEAKIIDIVNNLYKKDFGEIYCDHLLWNRKYIFYFSGKSLFIFTHNFELHYKIEYITVESVYNEDENLIIKYKQENGEDNPPSAINCEEEDLAQKLSEYFQNYLNINFINS